MSSGPFLPACSVVSLPFLFRFLRLLSARGLPALRLAHGACRLRIGLARMAGRTEVLHGASRGVDAQVFPVHIRGMRIMAAGTLESSVAQEISRHLGDLRVHGGQTVGMADVRVDG